MTKLENLLPDSIVSGIEKEPVQITRAVWRGDSMLQVFYLDLNGQRASRFLLRSDESNLNLEPKGSTCSGINAKLLLETLRMQAAKKTDPFLAVNSSSINPLPHQISAVYQEMLPRIPLRFLLADDPGAGKTIMTGLLIKELIVREDMKRCLIVCPGGLSEQWKDELAEKFSLNFTILTSSILKEKDPFGQYPFSIASVDILARNGLFKEKLEKTEWDLIVVDEAHKLSATVWGKEVKYTKRYLLGQLLSKITKNFLLLTATPHNGKSQDFELFMSLLDPDRFEGAARNKGRDLDISDLMRRMVKESLLNFDGTPLFPKRYSYTVYYHLSASELELYEAVTNYVRHEFNRAERLEKSKRNNVGFALTVLQRRLASSPEAIYHSLKNRKEKLKAKLRKKLDNDSYRSKHRTSILEDDDEYSASQREHDEDQAFETASLNPEELKAEIYTLELLENKAHLLCQSGKDRKWEELSELIQNQKAMINPKTGQREKLIIFTEHKDTISYLEKRLGNLLGNSEAVLTISGSTSRAERKKIANIFKNDPEALILLATDAAGEGINLQNAHLMINYDLPWNPNRLEQRFGRIHRIGQKNDCYLWNLCSVDTREGQVYSRLLEKLDTEKEALGGKVFDILGKISFDNQSLADLLLDVVLSDTTEEIFERVETELNLEHLKELLKEEALNEELMTPGQVFRIKEEMERAEAHKVQPHFIEAYFLELFQYFGGQTIAQTDGSYELKFVPFQKQFPKQYKRVYFEPKEDCEGELITLGHPLLEKMMDLFLEAHKKELNSVMVLTDAQAESQKVLYVLKCAIEDQSQKVIYEQLHFLIEENGKFKNGGYAPYLDYMASKTDNLITKPEFHQKKAEEYARINILEPEKQKLESLRKQQSKKAERAVWSRLTQEIQYWDYRASELHDTDPLNARKAANRANELEERLKKRLERFDQERHLNVIKPELLATVVITPEIKETVNETQSTETHSSQTKKKNREVVERLAMEAVFNIERSLGNVARDVSKENVGYDIESRSGNGNLRFIEVKGRAKGSDTVTVTKNEILTALNRPDDFILALVEVDGNQTDTIYLKRPFLQSPEFSIASINYHQKDLIRQAQERIKYGKEKIN